MEVRPMDGVRIQHHAKRATQETYENGQATYQHDQRGEGKVTYTHVVLYFSAAGR